MKKLLRISLFLLVVLCVVSACKSPFKKRKKCRGNGSWYGNRNLHGAVQPKEKINKTYAFKDSDFTSSVEK